MSVGQVIPLTPSHAFTANIYALYKHRFVKKRKIRFQLSIIPSLVAALKRCGWMKMALRTSTTLDQTKMIQTAQGSLHNIHVATMDAELLYIIVLLE